MQRLQKALAWRGRMMKSFFRATLSIICNEQGHENPFGKETYAPNMMH
jgi:hypothetical protein